MKKYLIYSAKRFSYRLLTILAFNPSLILRLIVHSYDILVVDMFSFRFRETVTSFNNTKTLTSPRRLGDRSVKVIVIVIGNIYWECKN